jgi:hypothetical protein
VTGSGLPDPRCVPGPPAVTGLDARRGSPGAFGMRVAPVVAAGGEVVAVPYRTARTPLADATRSGGR